MESGEGWKLEPLSDQLLQRHIDDIGEIFQRPRGILARALHRLLGLVAPGLDPGVIANQEHVPATDRTGTVTEQIFGDRTVASALCHMFEYGTRDFRQRYEVPETLKGLEQCQKTDARR